MAEACHAIRPCFQSGREAQTVDDTKLSSCNDNLSEVVDDLPVMLQLDACCRWTTVRGDDARCRHNDLVGSDAPQQAGTQRMSLSESLPESADNMSDSAHSCSKRSCLSLHASCKSSTAKAVKNVETTSVRYLYVATLNT